MDCQLTIDGQLITNGMSIDYQWTIDYQSSTNGQLNTNGLSIDYQ